MRKLDSFEELSDTSQNGAGQEAREGATIVRVGVFWEIGE